MSCLKKFKNPTEKEQNEILYNLYDQLFHHFIDFFIPIVFAYFVAGNNSPINKHVLCLILLSLDFFTLHITILKKLSFLLVLKKNSCQLKKIVVVDSVHGIVCLKLPKLVFLDEQGQMYRIVTDRKTIKEIFSQNEKNAILIKAKNKYLIVPTFD